MISRMLKTLKQLCIHYCHVESQQYFGQVFGNFIYFYNNQRYHQAHNISTTSETFRLTALPMQLPHANNLIYRNNVF